MKRVFFSVIIIAMIFALRVNHFPIAHAQAESDAPYIYYYSDILNAFVIERADGSDSRLIGEGLTPDDANTIAGPGWSPSGEWLAWTATYRFWAATTGQQPFVVQVNGEHLTQFDDYVDATLEWSPTEDVLVVAGVKGTFEPLEEPNDYISVPMIFSVEMIDVTTNSVIVSFETPQVVDISNEIGSKTTIYYPAMPSIRWSVDGQHAVISYYAEELIAETSFDRQFLILGRDGSTREIVQEIAEVDFALLDFANSSSIHAGKIASFQDDYASTLVIDDILTNEHYEIAINQQRIERVVLNPTENAALLFTTSIDCYQSTCPTDIWLWDARNDSTTIVLQDTSPDSVEWSPDGQYALLIISDMSPYLLTLQSFSVDRLDEVSPPLANAWVGGHQVRFIEGNYDSPIAFDYDLEMHSILRLFHNSLGYDLPTLMNASWSPDGEKIVFIFFDIGIYDVTTESQILLGADGRSLNSVYGGEALWHENGEWFLTWENATVAGGGSPNAWMGVASADGTINRDLTFCTPFDPCLGWLPDKLNRSLLPEGQSRSVVPEANDIIHATDWTYSLSWSPDGRLIARGSTADGSGNNTIFEVGTHSILQELPELDEGQHVEWQANDDGTYVATVSTQSQVLPEIGSWTFASSLDGQYAVVVLENMRNPVLYDIQAAKVIYEIDDIFNVIATFSPDGRLIVLSGDYNPVQIRETMTGDLITTLNNVGTALAFSPDGQTLAVASSWDIQLWDVEDLLSRGD